MTGGRHTIFTQLNRLVWSFGRQNNDDSSKGQFVVEPIEAPNIPQIKANQKDVVWAEHQNNLLLCWIGHVIEQSTWHFWNSWGSSFSSPPFVSVRFPPGAFELLTLDLHPFHSTSASNWLLNPFSWERKDFARFLSCGRKPINVSQKALVFFNRVTPFFQSKLE